LQIYNYTERSAPLHFAKIIGTRESRVFLIAFLCVSVSPWFDLLLDYFRKEQHVALTQEFPETRDRPASRITVVAASYLLTLRRVASAQGIFSAL
jgi:hypothetical protein